LSFMQGMGPTMRMMRTDRSVVDNKLDRRTVRRVFGFARPHRRAIGAFLGVTVLDALLVVVTPLLIQHTVDDGILKHDISVVLWLAAAMAVTAIFDALLGLGGG
jgi:ATP-binding cassette subfamily B protein